MSKTVGTPTLLLLLMIFGGCSSAPVLNMKDTAITGQHSTDEVRQAIVAACAERGWVVKEAGPGVLRATLNVRTFARSSISLIRLRRTASRMSAVRTCTSKTARFTTTTTSGSEI
jgi:hypothetical protein